MAEGFNVKLQSSRGECAIAQSFNPVLTNFKGCHAKLIRRLSRFDALLRRARFDSPASRTAVSFFDNAAQVGIHRLRVIPASRIDQLVGMRVHLVAAFGTDQFTVCHFAYLLSVKSHTVGILSGLDHHEVIHDLTLAHRG